VGLELQYDTLLYAVLASGMVGAGALILTRYPRHAVGWLLCGNVITSAASDLAQGWGLRAAALDWPGGPVAEWISAASWALQAPALILIFLLFPDGRLPGRRWWSVLAVGVAGALLATVGWSLDPDTGSEFVAGRNQFATTRLPTDLLFAVGLAILAVTMVLSVLPLILRFCRARGIERQQLKWFAFAGVVIVTTLPISGSYSGTCRRCACSRRSPSSPSRLRSAWRSCATASTTST